MLLSMTGYASQAVEVKTSLSGLVRMVVEIKSINGRFFEAVCKLPSALSSLEVDIITMLQKKLLRGRVYVTIKMENEAESFAPIRPSLKNIQEYLDAAEDIKKQFKVSGTLSLSDIFHLPHVFIVERADLGSREQKAIFAAVDQVADQLAVVRQEEGKRLLRDFVKRFQVCKKRIGEVTKKFERLVLDVKKEIDHNLVLSEKGGEVVRIKLEELYATLNKIDIHEEITRFSSHLENVESLIKDSSVEKGKRLDFVLQELLRETNTIMAKCSNFDISSSSVDIKVELEKAREQIQNIV